jgi:hemoglobin
MRTNILGGIVLRVLAILLAFTFVACGGGDDDPVVPPEDTTVTEDTAPAEDVADPAEDVADPAEDVADPVDDTATADDVVAPQSLYERLGGNAGIAAAVDAVVAAEAADAEIVPFFAPSLEEGAVPSLAQIKECLVNQLGAATGGPETYPSEVSDGYMCRDMVEAHVGLGISSDIFDKFVSIAADTLAGAGVAEADLAVIGGALNSMKGDIVEEAAPSLCDTYCDLASTNCSGDNVIDWGTGDCQAACAAYPADAEEGATGGNSVQCRIYHLGVAGSDGDTSAAVHCPHGSVDGGGVCADAEPTLCDTYCDLAETNCTGDNVIDFGTDGCQASCALYPADGEDGAAGGDSVQCRIYHLGVAGSDGDTSAAVHCPHGSVGGGGVCQ